MWRFHWAVAVNRLLPVLGQADADKGKGLHLAADGRGRVVGAARRVGDTAVALGLPSGFPLLGPLVEHDTSGPAVVPDANHLEHISALEGKLVGCSRLVGPEDGHLVGGVNVVVGIVVLEEGQLLRLLAAGAAGRRVLLSACGRLRAVTRQQGTARRRALSLGGRRWPQSTSLFRFGAVTKFARLRVDTLALSSCIAAGGSGGSSDSGGAGGRDCRGRRQSTIALAVGLGTGTIRVPFQGGHAGDAAPRKHLITVGSRPSHLQHGGTLSNGRRLVENAAVMAPLPSFPHPETEKEKKSEECGGADGADDNAGNGAPAQVIFVASIRDIRFRRRRCRRRGGKGHGGRNGRQGDALAAASGIGVVAARVGGVDAASGAVGAQAQSTVGEAAVERFVPGARYAAAGERALGQGACGKVGPDELDQVRAWVGALSGIGRHISLASCEIGASVGAQRAGCIGRKAAGGNRLLDERVAEDAHGVASIQVTRV